MIYFLRCEVTGLVKIGFSTDERTLMRRVSDLRVGASTPLRFMAVVSGTIDDERDYHLVQRALHSHGEWFRIPLEDLPPDELGLADALNGKGTPKHFGDRTCHKCGKQFLVRRGMSRWKPRAQKKRNGKIKTATVKQLAQVSGVSYRTIRRSLAGEPLYPMQSRKLAAVTGVSAEELRRGAEAAAERIEAQNAA